MMTENAKNKAKRKNYSAILMFTLNCIPLQTVGSRMFHDVSLRVNSIRPFLYLRPAAQSKKNKPIVKQVIVILIWYETSRRKG